MLSCAVRPRPSRRALGAEPVLRDLTDPATWSDRVAGSDVAAMVRRCADEKIETIEVRPDAEKHWDAAMREAKRPPVNLECQPGDTLALLGSTYGRGPEACMQSCRDWLDHRFEVDLDSTHL